MRKHGRHMPPPIVRRMGCAFAALIVLAAIGASTLASLLWRSPHRAFPLSAAGVLLILALALAFRRTIRPVVSAFAEQNRLRRQLMADVAHELRTPLSILQGRIEGLLDGVYPRDDVRLAELLAETRHLARLVEDLGTLAHAEAGALELRKETVDVGDLLRDVAAALPRPRHQAADPRRLKHRAAALRQPKRRAAARRRPRRRAADRRRPRHQAVASPRPRRRARA